MRNIKYLIRGTKISFGFNPSGNILFFLIAVINSSLAVYVTVILGNMIDDIKNKIGGNGSFKEIIFSLILFGVISILLYIFMELRWRFSEDILPLKSKIKAQKDIIKLSENIPVREFDREDFNTEYSKFTDGYTGLCAFLPSVTLIFNISYRLILSSVILFQMHFSFPIIVLIFFVISFALNINYADTLNDLWEKTKKISRKSDYLSSQFSGKSNRDTRLLNLKDKFINEWLGINRTLTNLSAKGRKKTDRPFAICSAFSENIAGLISIVICLFLIGNGVLQIGAIYVIWNLINNTVGNAQNFQRSVTNLILGGKKLKITFDFYDKYSKIKNKETSEDIKSDVPIEIKNLTYKYGEDIIAIDDLSLNINKGESIALIGENGSGKSTLIKCIIGLYKPENGSVKIYGNESYDTDEEIIRKYVSITFQDYCTYPFTLRENVGFGEITEIANDDKILTAIEFANADEILKKCGKLDAVLGRQLEPDGLELSGGQWQRLALARAYMNMRDIAIFDEPSAALDPIAELKQFENLKSTLKNKTSILISHRIGFARLADKIVVMDNGRIAEQGTHDYLISLNGKYAEMFNAQKKWYDLDYDEKEGA
ncbi:MAG: ABC transporter ATP-binding protein/permease [Oscillospiraceae bacterium]|nr:ABC transporter ATP-binding protein/permease [Oscillospiraceae bacterium]